MRLFFTSLMLVSLALTGCLKKLPAQNSVPAINSTATVVEQPATPAVTPEQYQTALHLALQPFWQEQNIAETKAAVLALSAPAELLTLHFQVVVALETIEQGQLQADQAQIEDGFDRLNSLAQQYSWLK